VYSHLHVADTFESPEAAALSAVERPEGADTPVVTSAFSPDGSTGVFLINDPRPGWDTRPVVVCVVKQADGWVYRGGGWGAGGWTSTRPDDESEPDLGVRYVYDPAPEWASEAHLRVGDHVESVPVVSGWFLHCQWDSPFPPEGGVAAKVCGYN
jgi:hypothetical protein